MSKQDVDKTRVKVSIVPPPDSPIKQVDDVFIVVTQAFCPNGHNLIDSDGFAECFDGYPGIKLTLTSEEDSGSIVLSPIHGDATKKGKTDWPEDTKLEVTCPICSQSLPKLASCSCGGELVKLYLSPKLSDSHVLGMCNAWGCRRSRTINNWQIISEYLDGQIED